MRRSKFTKKEEDQVIALKKEGYTHKEISEITGVNAWSVKNIITRNGLTKPQQAKKSNPTGDTKSDILIRDAWKKPLHECHPREIFDYLRSIGYRGELEYTFKIKI